MRGYDAWKTAAPEPAEECPECGEAALEHDPYERDTTCTAEGCDYSVGYDWDEER